MQKMYSCPSNSMRTGSCGGSQGNQYSVAPSPPGSQGDQYFVSTCPPGLLRQRIPYPPPGKVPNAKPSASMVFLPRTCGATRSTLAGMTPPSRPYLTSLGFAYFQFFTIVGDDSHVAASRLCLILSIPIHEIIKRTPFEPRKDEAAGRLTTRP